MTTKCKVGGCSSPVSPELRDYSLCLDHFLDNVQERCSGLARQLELEGFRNPLRQAATQFIVASAARLARIGTDNPPKNQLARGRLLNAMLLLAELRERFDQAAAKKAGA
ncbi:MAG: hypothetical protein V3R29_12800 [Candidatus Acidoferrales bacterium]